MQEEELLLVRSRDGMKAATSGRVMDGFRWMDALELLLARLDWGWLGGSGRGGGRNGCPKLIVPLE